MDTLNPFGWTVQKKARRVKFAYKDCEDPAISW